MEYVTFTTGQDPEIILTNVGGDLRLFGWEQNQFQAEAEDSNTLDARQDGERITLHAKGDCTVRVPRQVRLTLQHVGGDARVKSLGGPLSVEAVGGDLILRQTAAVNVGTVSGDLKAKKILGDVHIQMAAADVSARSVTGEFAAQRVGGDLYLRDVGAGARAEVGGDIALNLEFIPDHVYGFHAGGDIRCWVSGDVSANMKLDSGGEIVVSVPGAQVTGEPTDRTVVLGDGKAQVKLEAGGDISVTGLTADPDAMGEFGEHFGEEFGVMAEEFAVQIESQVEAQIESQMADFEKHLQEKLAYLDTHLGHGRVDAEKIAARAREAVERAAEKARRQTEAAERKADAARRKAEALARAAARRAERQAEHTKRHVLFAWKSDAPRAPRPPTAPLPPRAPGFARATQPVEPISDEERMSILRMVEQKKISVAEAEKLLAALENK